ncbi:MAG: L-threonylcarbamoyladenylate synthase [Oscillospiraceae bacterium]
MKSRYDTRVLPGNDVEAVSLAGRLLREGELVAIPTETVYGLAANALNPVAVARIFQVKGRPQDNPLIVHISELSMWRPLVRTLPETALRLAAAFWPGPLTIILPRDPGVPDVTTAKLDTVAVRMPYHPAARAVIRAAGVPLAAPSANLSGLPSPTTAAHCLNDLAGRIPLILDGGECSVGIESTVVTLAGEHPLLLRPGVLTTAMLSEALGEPVAVAAAVEQPLAAGEKPFSPGMKYRHYAPKARVILLEGSLASFLQELDKASIDTVGLVFAGEETQTAHPCIPYGAAHDAESQARGLFAALRLLDERGAKLAYARCPDRNDETLGVYNRMLRAAAFEVRQI